MEKTEHGSDTMKEKFKRKYMAEVTSLHAYTRVPNYPCEGGTDTVQSAVFHHL